MRTSGRLAVGLPALVAGLAVALNGGLGPIVDWVGWLLLLPGAVVVASCIRRGVVEPLAIALLVVGGVWCCQPHLPALFACSTGVLVVAGALFTVASHLAPDAREPTRAGARLRVASGALLALGALAALQPWWPALAPAGACALVAAVVGTVAGALCARRMEPA